MGGGGGSTLLTPLTRVCEKRNFWSAIRNYSICSATILTVGQLLSSLLKYLLATTTNTIADRMGAYGESVVHFARIAMTTTQMTNNQKCTMQKLNLHMPMQSGFRKFLDNSHLVRAAQCIGWHERECSAVGSLFFAIF